MRHYQAWPLAEDDNSNSGGEILDKKYWRVFFLISMNVYPDYSMRHVIAENMVGRTLQITVTFGVDIVEIGPLRSRPAWGHLC